MELLGHKILQKVGYFLSIFSLFYMTVRSAILSKTQSWRTVISVVAAQIFFTGWQALIIISGLGFVIGFMFVLQMSHSVVGFGNVEGTIKLLLSVAVREFSPLLTGLIVIARSGTAVASELGNMKVNREVDALLSMGIHPLNFIVFPRLVGGIISVLILGFYFALSSILGAILGSHFLAQVPLAYFTEKLFLTLASSDFILLFFKLFLSGLLIFTISSYHGLSAKKSPTEVPVVTTQAVMRSIVSVIICNILISLSYYLYEFNKEGLF
jgi:phospholipid/cholesterol/gamma-HCH transport system permease protein